MLGATVPEEKEEDELEIKQKKTRYKNRITLHSLAQEIHKLDVIMNI